MKAGAVLALSCALLAACASPPGPLTPATDPRSPVVADEPSESPFETRQREHAASLARQGRWGDAAIAWEVLGLLRPEVEEYRSRRIEAEARAVAVAQDHETRAAQAFRRGDLESALRHDLAALSMVPSNRGAAENLKAIERERVRRSSLGRYVLDRYSRLTLAGRDAHEGELAPPPAAASSPGRGVRPRPPKPAASR